MNGKTIYKNLKSRDLKKFKKTSFYITEHFWDYKLEDRDMILDGLLELCLNIPNCQSNTEKLYSMGSLAEQLIITYYFQLEDYQKEKIKSSIFDRIRKNDEGSSMILRQWLSRVDKDAEFIHLYENLESKFIC